MAVFAPGSARQRPRRPGPWQWARENLFSSPWNTVLTLAVGLLLVLALRGALGWALTEARWSVIPENWRLLMVGPYPRGELWRVWGGVLAVALLAGLQWGRSGGPGREAYVGLGLLAAFGFVVGAGGASRVLIPAAVGLVALGAVAGRLLKPSGRALTVGWAALFVVVLLLIGLDLGRGGVPTNLWGGLLLTMILSVAAIVASFPLGVALAVGRASRLPVVSGLCVAYIELVRGVPLVVVLFVAQLFVPLFLGGLQVDPVVRAMVGLTLFTAAYLAEYVRGGLRAVASGQAEAARALGLSGTQTLGLIVLPQALRAVIPGLVGQFIALFKDTSLVAIIGLLDLLRVGTTITANPAYIGRYKEVYLAVALIYFVFSYAMSLGSRRLETRLSTSR